MTNRGTLFTLWSLPIIAYCVLLIIRPTLMADDFSSVTVEYGIFTIGQIFSPIIAVFLIAWFPMGKKGRLQSLTAQRFWVALGCMASFHLITFLYFYFNVYAPDYASAETCSEMFEGRLNSFAKIATYLSFLPLIPIKFLFERTN